MARTTKTLDVDEIMTPDNLAMMITNRWVEWDQFKREAKERWKETKNYIFATDTTQTTNAKLPWTNKTTIPKLCQIRDNLTANYMSSIFPKRRWLSWVGDDVESQTKDKKDAIESYISWAVEQPYFESEVAKIVDDYVDYGNVFMTVDWNDDTVEQVNGLQVGYVGPTLKRISPLDIVFNPTAQSFQQSPKIIRQVYHLGELKGYLESLANDDEREEIEAIFQYVKNIRSHEAVIAGDVTDKNDMFRMDGFDNHQHYLKSDFVEVLTFYGDLYDKDNDEFFKNHVITVVDRHKLVSNKPSSSLFGYPPIWHVPWRTRQDNIWGMGPLDNLLGLQYRLDHIENMKADFYDLARFPPLKIRGYVEDFDWGPMAHINVGDEGDVEVLNIDTGVLQANIEMQQIQALMEEMAGAPKEAMGFRSPGEKTMFEVQRMESAASRIFRNKTSKLERLGLELVLNGFLELARRNLNEASIRVFNSETEAFLFRNLTPLEITGSGRIKPIAARHFAEQAEMLQNLTQMYSTPMGQDPGINIHFSGVAMARMMEDLMNLDDYHIVEPYVRISEQKEAQLMQNIAAENVAMETTTPGGIAEDDTDEDFQPDLT